jgi:hypothetical protein
MLRKGHFYMSIEDFLAKLDLWNKSSMDSGGTFAANRASFKPAPVNVQAFRQCQQRSKQNAEDL